MFRYMNNKKNSDKYKGIFKQDNNDKNIWHVDLYGIENKNNTNNKELIFLRSKDIALESASIDSGIIIQSRIENLMLGL